MRNSTKVANLIMFLLLVLSFATVNLSAQSGGDVLVLGETATLSSDIHIC
jgi:hypothetical protein